MLGILKILETKTANVYVYMFEKNADTEQMVSNTFPKYFKVSLCMVEKK